MPRYVSARSAAQSARAFANRSATAPSAITGVPLIERRPRASEISRSTLDRAAELRGTAFDRLFIEAMVPHHRGAIEMAEERLAVPGDSAVSRWARAIATAQALEIDRLLEIEARLPAS